MNEDIIVTPAHITYKNKKTPFRIVYVVVILALIISCGSLLSFALYSTGIGISASGINIDYYAVSFGRFDSFQQATDFSHNIQLKGGAGVIYGEDNHVLCGMYKSKSDAEKVTNQNSDFPCEVVCLKVDKRYNNQLQVVDNLLNYSREYDQTLDSSTLSNALKNEINSLTNTAKNESNKMVKEFYNHVSDLLSAIISSQSNYSYTVKYVAITSLLELKNMSEI